MEYGHAADMAIPRRDMDTPDEMWTPQMGYGYPIDMPIPDGIWAPQMDISDRHPTWISS